MSMSMSRVHGEELWRIREDSSVECTLRVFETEPSRSTVRCDVKDRRASAALDDQKRKSGEATTTQALT